MYLSIKRLILVTVILLLSSSSSTLLAQSDPVFIKGGWYFDVDGKQMVKNDGILIRGGRFYQVGNIPSKTKKNDYKIVELGDNEYVLPGIMDIHAHYRMDGFGSDELKEIDEFKYNAMIFLANGVTSTWSAGVFYPYMELAAKHLINSGQWIGPRIWAAGPYFGAQQPTWKNYSKKEIYQKVDYWAEMGVDGFKTKRAKPEIVKYLIERAHYHGLTVTGHLDSGYRDTTSSYSSIEFGTTNAITAIDYGIDRIEHFLGGFVLDTTRSIYPVWSKVDTSSKKFKKTVKYYLDHGVFFDPTLNAPRYTFRREDEFKHWKDEESLFTPYARNLVKAREERESNDLMARTYTAMKRSTKAFYDAGGENLITLGTDAPTHGYFLAGFGSHREMYTMVQAGIPEAAVLKISSQNSANALGKGNLLGSIETGKLADLYVVKGNPLNDITNTRNIQFVMKSGEIYNPQKLIEKIRGKIGPSDSSQVNTWFKYQELVEEAKKLKRSK